MKAHLTQDSIAFSGTLTELRDFWLRLCDEKGDMLVGEYIRECNAELKSGLKCQPT